MRRVTELDAFRGLIAVGIMIFHIRFPKVFYGWTRVDFFFVLSGYLATAMILKRWGTAGFYRTFLWRRYLRLGPTYYLALVGLLLVNCYLPSPDALESLPQYLTLTQNVQQYWGGQVPAFSPHFFHTWSLALDVQFFLVWPLLVGLTGRKGLGPLALALIVMSVLARAGGASPYILLGRCDGFAMGGLLAGLLNQPAGGRNDGRAVRIALAVAGLGGLAVIGCGMFLHWEVLIDRPLPWPGLTILAVCVTYASLIGLIVCTSGHPVLAPLRDRRLCYLGTIGYGLYLFHPLVFQVVELISDNLGVERGLPIQVLMLVAGIVVAVLCREWVEEPLLAFRTRLASAREPARVPPPGLSPSPGCHPG